MKIQLKYLQNRTSNIRQDYIRKRYREAINHPLIDFTMRSLYCILPIDRPNFITLSHLFMKVDLNIKVKGYYIKLLHPTNRNAYLITGWQLLNPLNGSVKSSYIDNFLERNLNCTEFVQGIQRAKLGDSEYAWFLG